MTQASARKLIKRALVKLGVIDPARQPSDFEAEEGLDALNDLIDNWSLHRQTIYQVLPERHELVASQQDYTIGPGADFDQIRPIWIEGFSIVPDRTADPEFELPFRRTLDLPEWQAIPLKGTTAPYPYAVFYDRTFADATGYGVVKVFPVPTTSVADVLLYTPTPLRAFADLNTIYRFPPGYRVGLLYHLCLMLAPNHHKTPSDEIKAGAALFLGDIKRANVRPVEAEIDPRFGAASGHFDIYSGRRV